MDTFYLFLLFSILGYIAGLLSVIVFYYLPKIYFDNRK